MTEVPAEGVVSEVPGSATTGRRASGLVSPAHGPETDPATPLRGIALPDPPDVDVDAVVHELRRAAGAEFETPPGNGEYRGAVPVRHLPRGVSGEELAADKAARLVAGARWQRGTQLVQVVKSGRRVTYREILDHDGRPSAQPEKLHGISWVRFMETGRPA